MSFFLKYKGFTLIEALVVIGIIGILSSFTFLNYRTSQKEFMLERAAYKLVQDLRFVQRKSMESATIPSTNFSPPGGYGIYINVDEPNHYILFADCDSDKKYSTSSTPCAGKSELIEDVQIEKGVKISKLCFFLPQNPTPSQCSPSSDNISQINYPYIIFIPPEPITGILGGDEAEITLSLENDPNKSKVIFVGFSGLIYIKQ
jgi:prepilin-type N-terminal cleavage/methylation domain-containing protein